MLVIELGRLISFKEKHLSNALFPIEVTVFGMITFSRLWHRKKALSAIEVVFSSIINVVMCRGALNSVFLSLL